MSNPKPVGDLLYGRITFCKEFLKHPRQIGSIIPSSCFLKRRIVDIAGICSAKTIVELGPGSGGTTQAILRAAPSYARLLSIEVNPHLHSLVCSIEDNRLIAHLGDCHGLKEILSMYRLGAPEVIISGIPFSTMSNISGTQIIEEISTVLAPGGRFVAYQVSNRVAKLCRPFLGKEKMEVELFNIPPMRVYWWEKHDACPSDKGSSPFP
ncbi:class I SAM-dependent methyltransferase [Geotalea uraniireducens]|uniref:Phospholipid N-methyltransferase-like protein n=1 Tax=Geotalea uraniireducens (strain Rf4) TaxID=351605 RepID=A5GEC6_GEOUR|nr:phospholipid N-methyltransferase-like protein [Geotalea uraniireducens]ABQ25781.1 Phospholipid N-methyltransferase-like protein [Geotalea uraniireducens Rf4]